MMEQYSKVFPSLPIQCCLYREPILGTLLGFILMVSLYFPYFKPLTSSFTCLFLPIKFEPVEAVVSFKDFH